MNRFLDDVCQGLSKVHKTLNSKYFYDDAGDVLFQKIMNCKEYYLTRCEIEILNKYAPEISTLLKNGYKNFDLIELGPGDATKTIFILKELVNIGVNFTYVPIDISGSMIQFLQHQLPRKIPGLKVKGETGEYMDILKKLETSPDKRKVILFLGSNIGNFEPAAALGFFKDIHMILEKGDQVLIGFDLKKNPLVILQAYNDKQGLTREFNLNLLKRINKELNANFIIDCFEHYPTYDPISGACKSYLISKIDQEVKISENVFFFKKNESIQMEISQKYDLNQIRSLAIQAGFENVSHFVDEKNWFVDVIWECRK